MTARKNSAPRRSARSVKKAATSLTERTFASRQAWSNWLRSHHASSPELWLKMAKKGAEGSSISYSDALDIAMSWGWIDGQKRAVDENWWLQRFTPRTENSAWSKINCAKAEALIAAGEMQQPG